jgi:predicted O-methyltransferase YrrM
MIVSPQIEEYLDYLTPLDHELLLEMENVAKESHVPIIGRPSIQFIRTLLHCKENVTRILEVGTAIGYSTIWLAEAVKEAHVDTIERDEERYHQANGYIKRANLNGRITLHLADAMTYSNQLNQTYDVIFIDAAKGQYQLFFEEYTKLLNPNGLVITDNVFFHGEVVSEYIENKRIRSLVKKIKSYNEWLKSHPDYETSFVPIGDGLALSVKKERSPNHV